jgi:hypothetical protein
MKVTLWEINVKPFGIFFCKAKLNDEITARQLTWQLNYFSSE